MSFFEIEFGNWGSIVMLGVVVGFLLLYFGGASAWGLLVGAAVLAVGAFIFYYLGMNIDYKLKHGWGGS